MAGFVYSDTETVVRTKEGLLRGFKAGGVYQFPTMAPEKSEAQ